MTIPVLINLQTLIDEQKCYETVRQLRWPEGVTCSKCNSQRVVKRGFDETQPYRQRYQCQACQSRFDDLSGTILNTSCLRLKLGKLNVNLLKKPLEPMQLKEFSFICPVIESAAVLKAIETVISPASFRPNSWQHR